MKTGFSIKKLIVIIIIIIAALAIYRLILFFITSSGNNQKVTESKKIPVKAVSVKRMNIVESIDLTGDISGIEVVNVFPQVPGKVRNILIKEGDRVYKGMVIFRLDRDIVGMNYMPAIVESPISGYVGKVMVDRGMAVTQTVPLAQIVNMTRVEAIVRIMEKDINRVKNGMPAEIKTAAFPDKIFKGRVYKKSAVLDSVSRTQEVKILIQNPGTKLKHGMFSDVRIIISKKINITTIPEDSILYDEKGKPYVFTVNNSKAVKNYIEKGITVNYNTEILKGLSLTDTVVTLGKENILEGDELLVYLEDDKKKLIINEGSE